MGNLLRAGICMAINKAIEEMPYIPKLEELTPQYYGIKKPIGAKGGYWWPLDARGYAIRKRAVKNAIKRLESCKKIS